jgi:hypothetical protein
VDEGIHFCDDDLTGNVVDTSYARLDDIHLRAVPGVLSTGFATRVPLGGSITNTRVAPENSAASTSGQPQFPYTYVSESYFRR